MMLTAFDENSDEHGQRDDLLATGTVEPSPDWLQCKGLQMGPAHRSARRPAPIRPSVTSGRGVLPNKRLKLPGGDRLKRSGVFCAGAHELSFNYAALGGRVARSLSAIR